MHSLPERQESDKDLISGKLAKLNIAKDEASGKLIENETEHPKDTKKTVNNKPDCSLCHTPYTMVQLADMNVELKKCSICKLVFFFFI